MILDHKILVTIITTNISIILLILYLCNNKFTLLLKILYHSLTQLTVGSFNNTGGPKYHMDMSSSDIVMLIPAKEYGRVWLEDMHILHIKGGIM